MGLLQLELRYAIRSLWRAKWLSLTVILTLALGIGVNAAIFSLVRSVLVRPLTNRDAQRIIYVRQSAPGLGTDNVTFSVPEIRDMRERARTLEGLAEFSTLTFSMVGLGEPRVVRAGVVSGNYFDVVGLRPVLGRLLTSQDEGEAAAGAAVVTHRFWTTVLQRDPSIIGKSVRLGQRTAVIVGVLEPTIPYPAETELIANVVTSPHHLSATMVTGREHRMTEVFGKLSPGASVDAAREEIASVYNGIKGDHAEAYPVRAGFAVRVVPLRDQLTSNARTVLIALLAASLLIFLIACSNVANLILARTVRRESELAIRAALGAYPALLRRTLLAESLILCGTGALLGVVLAWPMVTVLSRYASRFSVRALEMTVDATLLWAGAGLAILAAVLLAYVPKLPSEHGAGGLKVAGGSARVAGGIRRRLNAFAVTQVGASFVLLAGAAMLLRTLLALQAASPGFDPSKVLAVNVPVTSYGREQSEIREFYRQVRAQVSALPGVERVAVGSAVPWRDIGQFERATFAFAVEGATRGAANEDARAKFRSVSPGYFAALGLPIIAGRDFTADDRADGERVAIVSQSVATRLLQGKDVVNRQLSWTDDVMKFVGISPEPRRIIGVVPDVDDEHIAPGQVLTVYHPFEQEMVGGRIFAHTNGDPYSLVPEITKTVRKLAEDQPVEQAATLDDIRAEVLAPERLNTVVFGSFAGVALAVAVIGVAGVLAFAVSGRTREFGIRMALGSYPSAILTGVLSNGMAMAAAGIVVGIAGGFIVARLAARYFGEVQLPGWLPLLGAVIALVMAAIVASLVPAARAARINVMEALRSE